MFILINATLAEFVVLFDSTSSQMCLLLAVALYYGLSSDLYQTAVIMAAFIRRGAQRPNVKGHGQALNDKVALRQNTLPMPFNAFHSHPLQPFLNLCRNSTT